MSKYTSIQNEAVFEFKDRGSRFIGYTFAVFNKDEVAEKLQMLKLQHAKARHVCYAYFLSMANDEFRANDDGEPSGSAGLPILNQLKSAQLSYTLVAVVRYFGGTKLGVPGLINAYKTTAKEVIALSGTIEEDEKLTMGIEFTYDLMETVMSFIKHNNALVQHQVFTEKCTLHLQIRKDDYDLFFSYFEKNGLRLF